MSSSWILGYTPTPAEWSERLGVSVTEFGAVHDGITDDKTAIQNAINAGASRIYFPPGTYALSASVNMSVANQTLIFGNGATLQLTAGAKNGDIIQLSTNNIAILGGTFDGNATNLTGTNANYAVLMTPSTGVVHTGQLIDGATVKNAAAIGIGGFADVVDLTVRNCHISNCKTFGIYVSENNNTPTRVRIYDNYIDQTANASTNDGIYIPSFTDLLIARNRVILPTGGTNDICIEVGVGGSISATYATVVDNVTEGGYMGVSTNTATGVVVNNNRIYNPGLYGIEFARSKQAACSGNLILGNNLCLAGIVLDGASPFSFDISIAGNTIVDAVEAGIELNSCTRFSLAGNVIRRTTAAAGVFSGISMNGTGSRDIEWSIVGGEIDCFTTTSTSGIEVENAYNGSITGVHIINAGTGINLYGTVAETVDNITVTGCSFTSVTTPIPVYSSGLFTGGSSAGTNIRALGCTGLGANGNATNTDILDWVGNVKSFSGTGSPSASVTAGPGSIYLNKSGGTGTTFYVKESGTGNTVWVAK